MKNSNVRISLDTNEKLPFLLVKFNEQTKYQALGTQQSQETDPEVFDVLQWIPGSLTEPSVVRWHCMAAPLKVLLVGDFVTPDKLKKLLL